MVEKRRKSGILKPIVFLMFTLLAISVARFMGVKDYLTADALGRFLASARIWALLFTAKHLGLDTHPMEGFYHDGVRKGFGVPENYWLPLLLAVGVAIPATIRELLNMSESNVIYSARNILAATQEISKLNHRQPTFG